MPPYTVVYFPVRGRCAALQTSPCTSPILPASPGPHAWALWEGPAGGSPGGRGE
uniref:Uncharacterized protein n=1 Tax=Piliocolobus tephrosceles TaxID=591936 RepID=A0A8C9HLR8_9PRIM